MYTWKYKNVDVTFEKMAWLYLGTVISFILSNPWISVCTGSKSDKTKCRVDHNRNANRPAEEPKQTRDIYSLVQIAAAGHMDDKNGTD